jgi:membrane-bound ClpP family serine protease
VGIAVIDGKRYQVVSNGSAIEKGATVRVVEVHGNRIVVERAEQA